MNRLDHPLSRQRIFLLVFLSLIDDKLETKTIKRWDLWTIIKKTKTIKKTIDQNLRKLVLKYLFLIWHTSYWKIVNS